MRTVYFPLWENLKEYRIFTMKIGNKKVLNDFKLQRPNASEQINSWREEVNKAEWKTPNELKSQYGNASILKNRHVIFNICGNKYRLWVQISYQFGMVFVKRIGTHEEYDNWDIK